VTVLLLLLLLLLLLFHASASHRNSPPPGASELLYWNLDNPSRPRLQSNGASISTWATNTVLLGWDVIGQTLPSSTKLAH
jgi:hypothetical protein